MASSIGANYGAYLRIKMLFWRRKRTQADFSEELQAHLALEADRLREEGVSEEEASAMAQRNLGNITQAKEQFYESHRWLWTAIAVLSLALGIGANNSRSAFARLIHQSHAPLDCLESWI